MKNVIKKNVLLEDTRKGEYKTDCVSIKKKSFLGNLF